MVEDKLPAMFEPYIWEWFSWTFSAPSPPQTAAWPIIANGKHTLIFSPTGSGKTLAAFLWCINEMFRLGSEQALEDKVYVLYVSPLKALNNDIQKNLEQPLRGIRAAARKVGISVPEVRSAVRTGDTTQKQRAAMVRRPPHILITTPESLYIILATQKFREAFTSVRYVIVDEIHAISDNKRGVHLSLSLERLQHLVGCEFVRIGLSATQKPLEEIGNFLVGVDEDGKPRQCEIVDVGGRKNLDVEVISPVDNLLEAHFDAIWGSSYDQMLSMVRKHDTTLIFTNSRYKTERTALRLNELAADDSIQVGAHHGSMSKRVRLGMENKLKGGQLDALVATSSLELGIDVGSINLVCQIQSPKSVSSGMQRIGRAGHLLHATSKGRLLVADRDDLVESAVLVRAILDGQIDTTRIPMNCLDVLAQQIVGTVAADVWSVDDLFALCRRSYCYRNLSRQSYEQVLDMLSGNYELRMEYAPYPKISWDKVNNMLYSEPSARLIAFRAGGTIPDISEYDVYFASRKTVVGKLGEGFVEELHAGDIFILGSSSWRVLGIKRNRVIVEDVYGKAPTIPFWFGDRASRTYDLGKLVGQFRKTISERINLELQVQEGDSDGRRDLVNVIEWLQDTYKVNRKGAQAITEYIREQQFVTGSLPTDSEMHIEYFADEMGQQQFVIHSPFGIRVHDPWAMILCHAMEKKYGFRPISATVDDGILLSIPAENEIDFTAELGDVRNLLTSLITPENFDSLIVEAVLDSPIFKSRFRHNSVRAMMVLREYKGRRTPVWLQGMRSAGLLEACRDIPNFPLLTETLRECTHEALDVPNLREVILGLHTGAITAKAIETRVPSPFTHSLLLLGQYGELGSIPTQERRSRLMHLHQELLRQILDEETLRNMLDEDVVKDVELRLQRKYPKRARNRNELARLLLELGDLVVVPDDEISLQDRVEGSVEEMLYALAEERRAVLVPVTTAETNRDRWIATENFALYKAAFASPLALDDVDQHLLEALSCENPLPITDIPIEGDVAPHLDRLVLAYQVLRIVQDWRVAYIAADAWIPDRFIHTSLSRTEARLNLIRKYTRWHGPFTKYEVMERYGQPSTEVETALESLYEERVVAKGHYVPTKSYPQWCYRSNLEEIHRRTLARLRKEMEPASPEVFADFLVRWQHVHPDTRLEGIDGLRDVLAMLQGHENYQIIYERDIFPSRVKGYAPALLDRLCYSGEVLWRRFDPKSLKRGQIGFCFRKDQTWVTPDPALFDMKFHYRWKDDIESEVNLVQEYVKQHGACFFDDIVKDTGLDERLVLRAVWRLVWTGEATNDSYESIRYANVASGLSACYDLATHPGKKGVTIDMIVRHMESRKLNPRLGRWAPTERLVPPTENIDNEQTTINWAKQLLIRYGIVSRESLNREVSAPKWTDLRRAFIKLELLGEIRRGFFVEGLSGEQYAYPEAVEALRAAKLRRPDREGEENGSLDLVIVTLVDPANPFGRFFPLTNAVGNKVKVMSMPMKYLILRCGQPIILFEDRVTLLDDLPRETVLAAIRLLMGLVDNSQEPIPRKEVFIRQWNYHPTDISPARHLLTSLGFYEVSNRHKRFVYDGIKKPDDSALSLAEQELMDVYERVGKEESPIVYDEEWVISQAKELIQPKVRELILWLQKRLPSDCEFIYRPRYFNDFQVLYKGMRCINPHIQQKRIRLMIKFKGWSSGMMIEPDTDLNSAYFTEEFEREFAITTSEINDFLDEQQKRV